jgi:hypothetical protein
MQPREKALYCTVSKLDAGACDQVFLWPTCSASSNTIPTPPTQLHLQRQAAIPTQQADTQCHRGEPPFHRSCSSVRWTRVGLWVRSLHRLAPPPLVRMRLTSPSQLRNVPVAQIYSEIVARAPKATGSSFGTENGRMQTTMTRPCSPVGGHGTRGHARWSQPERPAPQPAGRV